MPSNTSTRKIPSLKAVEAEVHYSWEHPELSVPNQHMHRSPITGPHASLASTEVFTHSPPGPHQDLLHCPQWGLWLQATYPEKKSPSFFFLMFTGCQFFFFPPYKTKEGKNILISESTVQEKATGLLDSVSPHW